MATPPTLTIKGKSGTDYHFYMYKLPVIFSDSGGIYIYTIELPTGFHQYVYIGITNNLSTRFDNHHKANEIAKEGATHLSILWESNEAKRIEIEKDILGAISTLCNDHMN